MRKGQCFKCQNLVRCKNRDAKNLGFCTRFRRIVKDSLCGCTVRDDGSVELRGFGRETGKVLGHSAPEAIQDAVAADLMYEVHLCSGCIKDLDEHYPYLVPRDWLRIVEVPVADCDNSNLENYDERLHQRNPRFFISREFGPT